MHACHQAALTHPGQGPGFVGEAEVTWREEHSGAVGEGEWEQGRTALDSRLRIPSGPRLSPGSWAARDLRFPLEKQSDPFHDERGEPQRQLCRCVSTDYRGRLRASHDPTRGPAPPCPCVGDPGAEAGSGELGEDTGNEKKTTKKETQAGRGGCAQRRTWPRGGRSGDGLRLQVRRL